MANKHHNLGNRYAAKSEENAEAYIHARCTAKDKAAWIAKANAEGVKLTSWIIKTLNSSASDT